MIVIKTNRRRSRLFTANLIVVKKILLEYAAVGSQADDPLHEEWSGGHRLWQSAKRGVLRKKKTEEKRDLDGRLKRDKRKVEYDTP